MRAKAGFAVSPRFSVAGNHSLLFPTSWAGPDVSIYALKQVTAQLHRQRQSRSEESFNRAYHSRPPRVLQSRYFPAE